MVGLAIVLLLVLHRLTTELSHRLARELLGGLSVGLFYGVTIGLLDGVAIDLLHGVAIDLFDWVGINLLVGLTIEVESVDCRCLLGDAGGREWLLGVELLGDRVVGSHRMLRRLRLSHLVGHLGPRLLHEGGLVTGSGLGEVGRVVGNDSLDMGGLVGIRRGHGGTEGLGRPEGIGWHLADPLGRHESMRL